MPFSLTSAPARICPSLYFFQFSKCQHDNRLSAFRLRAVSRQKKQQKKTPICPVFFIPSGLRSLSLLLYVSISYTGILSVRRLISVHVFVFYCSVFSLISLFIQKETKIPHCVIRLMCDKFQIFFSALLMIIFYRINSPISVPHTDQFFLKQSIYEPQNTKAWVI